MSMHTLTVAALFALLTLCMALLVWVVTCTEQGAFERYLDALAYHRSGRARHTRPRHTATPVPALTPART